MNGVGQYNMYADMMKAGMGEVGGYAGKVKYYIGPDHCTGG